ncbi:hypothetical protein POTOM_060950 [Populus tomentosa]|uniref:Uncharacterized protein n=2 Tax=Populus TaxID=3689 RepID=A0A8X7XMU3_POPTO|nr:hypothetical protein POTOM_060950 [Populus tomentosa]
MVLGLGYSPPNGTWKWQQRECFPPTTVLRTRLPNRDKESIIIINPIDERIHGISRLLQYHTKIQRNKAVFSDGAMSKEDEFEGVGPADFDYLKKHVMQCYHKEDEEEISGDARNRSATKIKLNRGILEEDLKIELLRRLKSTTQADGDLGFSPGRVRWSQVVVFHLERKLSMWYFSHTVG